MSKYTTLEQTAKLQAFLKDFKLKCTLWRLFKLRLALETLLIEITLGSKVTESDNDEKTLFWVFPQICNSSFITLRPQKMQIQIYLFRTLIGFCNF